MVKRDSDGHMPIERGAVYELKGRYYQVLAINIEPPAECYWSRMVVIQEVRAEEGTPSIPGLTRVWTPMAQAKCYSQEYFFDAINDIDPNERKENGNDQED